MSNNLEQLTEVASSIAIKAGDIALSYFRNQTLSIDVKSDDSPVTVADRATEVFIRDELAQAFPEHAIFGEEFGVSGDLLGKSWIIDPIDGTRFFISGYPAFGLLLAHLDQGKSQIGIVHMPALAETFAGYRNGPATLNQQVISCSDIMALADAKIFINEPEKTFAIDPELFTRLCKVGHTRRMSYDCYPHAMVAAGRIDAVTDMGLEPYDYLPLVALVEAAGGVITDWNGKALTLQSDGRVLTAATAELHAEMLAFIAG